MQNLLTPIHRGRLPLGIIAIFFSLFLWACQNGQVERKGIKKISDRQEMGLQGPVKSLRIKSYKAIKNTKTGKVSKRGLSVMNRQNESYEFNKYGNIVERITYNSEDEVNQKWVYEYQENKRQVEEKVFNNGDEEPVSTSIIKYDKKGYKTESQRYTPGSDKPYKEQFKYNKNGDPLEEIHYTDGGPLKTIYKYDPAYKLIEKSEFQADNLTMKEIYEYDEEGHLITAKQDENRTVYASYIVEKKYKDNKLIERAIYKDDQPDSRYIYEYNKKGDQTGYENYDFDDHLLSSEKTDFEYDQNQNWIKEMPMDSSGIPKYLTEREIEYYNE